MQVAFSMRILEQPVTITAAQAAGARWLDSDRRTVRWPDVYLVMRHGGRYGSKWRKSGRHNETETAGRWHYLLAKQTVHWGGVALVHVNQPTNTVRVIDFYCEPIRRRVKKGANDVQ